MRGYWDLGRALMVLLLAALGAEAQSLPELLNRGGAVVSETITVDDVSPGHQYSVLYSLSSLPDMQRGATVRVEISQGAVNLASKVLHAGDADFYTHVRPPRAGTLTVNVSSNGARGQYRMQVNRWPLSRTVRRGPNHRWEDAQEITLGSTVFGSGDDAPYIPLPGTPRSDVLENPVRTDWYRFTFAESMPKLVFFQLELMERDQVPVNVTLYRMREGKLHEFFQGEDPVTLPHEVQALPGNKFIPRVLSEAGDYYVAVRAAHPEYKLRTRVYTAPPYENPRVAIRTALDYILGSGDSWHANTPRRGGVLSRVDSVHQETSLCVACHATHFPQRAQLYAARRGYPVVQRQQLQFLTERFYNNPRPLYGFEEQGATWARMISAAANVLGRMSHLLGIYEEEISGERRPRFHDGVSRYLDIYYAGREKLPADETNGNTPLVSAHEVAWYAWTTSRDPRLPNLIANGEIKNLVDLCYQTLALADIDAAKYRARIDANAQRILYLQRPNGQWAMQFDEGQPEAEFQTGHALWALHAAGVKAEDARVQKALRYLLARQQPWGGWLDPLQSYENFRTPFRETQMAVLALSAYYPGEVRERGWNSPRIDSLSDEPQELLRQLDDLWDRPSDAVLGEIREATKSNDALLRQAALEALGRLGEMPETTMLGDPSKMVQRTAAWATRQALSRRDGAEEDRELVKALESADDRVRWGAVRVFQQHFAALTAKPEFAVSLAKLLRDQSPAIRMDATRGLWQYWFWSANQAVRGEIEDQLLASLGEAQHPWVALNLRHAIYNIADENIRYLYNNWVPSIAREEDQQRVIRGRLAVESRLAAKFARILETGNELAKRELLAAVTELPLRRADVYRLDADLSTAAPPVYNRIGNDIEQITFFGESAERFAEALHPLLSSQDAEIRRLAAKAVLTVKPTRFGAVNKAAGATGENVKEVIAKVARMPEAMEVAQALNPPPPRQAVAGAGNAASAKAKLDQTYFRGYVQPILEKRGKDGYACVHCHASHAIFDGSYGTALKVVNQQQPENSLILLKPTSTSDSEGVAGAATVAHGGGLRWPKDSPEYVTILEWIKGAKE